jgi:hypothetical protein
MHWAPGWQSPLLPQGNTQRPIWVLQRANAHCASVLQDGANCIGGGVLTCSVFGGGGGGM